MSLKTAQEISLLQDSADNYIVVGICFGKVL